MVRVDILVQWTSFVTRIFQNGFLPSFHVFGSVVGAHVLHKGASSIMLDGFNPVTFLGANQDYKVLSI